MVFECFMNIMMIIYFDCMVTVEMLRLLHIYIYSSPHIQLYTYFTGTYLKICFINKNLYNCKQMSVPIIVPQQHDSSTSSTYKTVTDNLCHLYYLYSHKIIQT